MKRLWFAALLLLGAVYSPVSAQNENIVFRSKMTFPGKTIANVCGYAADGREYALLGASSGLIIVDVTNPDQPVQIVEVPGPNNLWKEIKTYSHYAYTVSEGGQGVNIVDMSNLPSATLNSHFYKGDGAIANSLSTIHALHIDVTKGFLYAYGSNLFSGGAVVLDLNNDPYNPTYVGHFDDLNYIHDGYVDNDTLYAAHINEGFFSIVDMTDKSNPQVLATQTTPNVFTHNTWISQDRRVIFTTDETADSYLAAYDVSDPTDIQFLNKIQSNPGSGSIVHNTHILGEYAVTAWYRDGVTIVDVARPENMVQTGNYDTYPGGEGNGFDGCWGVYPYLPSGTLVVGNIEPGEMWLLTPNYQRACYLEGLVTDAQTGQPINGADVQITGNINAARLTDANGQYKTGQSTAGEVTVTVSKIGYLPANLTATLANGEITLLNITLSPAAVVTVGGLVTRAGDGAAVAQAKVALLSPDTTYITTADANGAYSFTGVIGGNYDVVAGAWGYQYTVLANQSINSSGQYGVVLQTGYQDDFVFDYGWASTGSSMFGKWERGEPVGIDVGILLSPEHDVPGDIGDQCYVTGNGSEQPDVDDVDSGTAILTSPVMDLSGYGNPRISAKVFCLSVNQQQQFLDSIKVYIVNGTTETLVWKRKGNNFDWMDMSFNVTDYVPVSANMRLRVIARDNPGSVGLDSYEAAFDQFLVEDQPIGTTELTDQASIRISPNPFDGATWLEYQRAGQESRVEIWDTQGRLVSAHLLAGESGRIQVGENLQAGMYFVRLLEGNDAVRTLKMVKQ